MYVCIVCISLQILLSTVCNFHFQLVYLYFYHYLHPLLVMICLLFENSFRVITICTLNLYLLSSLPLPLQEVVNEVQLTVLSQHQYCVVLNPLEDDGRPRQTNEESQ